MSEMDEIRKAVEAERNHESVDERLARSEAFQRGFGGVVDKPIEVEPIIETNATTTSENAQLVVVDDGDKGKSITDISLADVKVKINTNRNAGEQAEEVIDYVATVAAAQDGDTVRAISDAKKEEIVEKAKTKAKSAQKQSVEADTEVQKAKQEKFELLFETFGVTKHVPDWMLNILLGLFTPFYILFVIIIGVPSGFIRFLVDAVDGILIRYDDAEETRRPKIKVTVLIVIICIIVAVVCLTVLKACGVI